MGWASAGEIFDAIASVVLRKYRSGNIDFHQSVEILAALAGPLKDGGWDTEDESVQEFNNHPLIVESLKSIGWKPYSEEDDGD